jgi:hypothetical protein
MLSSAVLVPASRFAGIINGLFHAIAVRRDVGHLAAPLAGLLWSRLIHLRGRINRIAARIAAGKGAGVPRGPRTARQPDAPVPERRQPSNPMPRGVGWMIRLVPEAAACGSQLQHLLAEPETAALIEAAPQLKRLLRPFCRSLSVDLPPALRPPPKSGVPKPRKPRTPRPPRTPANDAAAWRSRAVRKAAWPGLNRPCSQHGLPWLLHAPLGTPPPTSKQPKQA